MSVISNLQNLSSFSRINPTGGGVQGLKPFAPVEDGNRADLLRAKNRLLRVYRALETLAELANVETRFKLDLPDAISNAGLGLDLTTTAAALASTDEINASPMSFAPFGPDWTNGSSALLTIGGEYDGSQGSGALTFEVRRPGVKGTDNLRIRVEDPQGGQPLNINIRPNDAPDFEYTLGNGLFLTLGPGALIDRDTATIQVFDALGSAVDSDKPLGGVRNDNPNFQYYPAPNSLPPIVDGEFLLNGESISVGTTETLNDVVNRINQSNAGVTAVFNATTERIEFVQNTTGSVPTIDIQGDTSNFVLSTKLDAAVVTPGIDPEDEKVFANVGAFASIQTGDFLINGTPISIDTASDSLTSVIDRINESGAGVVASFDPGTQKVLIETQQSESVLELDSNGTGLFGALNLPEGRVDNEAVGDGISRRRSYEIADALETVFSELNYVFQDKNFVDRGVGAGLFRGPLESVFSSAFGETGSTVFGIRHDASADARRRGSFATLDRRNFTESLQIRGNDVQRFFSGDDDTNGFVGGLFQATEQALKSLSLALGESGTFVDTFV
jgi:hypothetical protein